MVKKKKNRSKENKKNYLQNKQISLYKTKNRCVSLLRKTKNSYYGTLNEKCVSNNKLFWKNR